MRSVTERRLVTEAFRFEGECPWLYEVSAHIGQQALVDLEKAFQRFFKGLTGEGPKSGFPRFKRKGERDAARLYGVGLSERHVRLPKIGQVRLEETSSKRGFEGRILSATITRRADRFVEPSQTLRRNLTKLRRLDRQVARTQRGSRNHEKAKLRRARLHYRISCRRQDYLHQLSASLAKTKSVIVLEDLHVKGMQQNRSLALGAGSPLTRRAKPASLKQEATARRARGATRRSTPEDVLVRV